MNQITLVLPKLFLRTENEKKVPKMTITQISEGDKDINKINSLMNRNATIFNKTLLGLMLESRHN